MFSERTNFGKSINALSVLRETLHLKGTKFFDLSLSNPTQAGFSPTDHLGELFAAHAAKPYTPDSLGLLEARQALADFWSKQADTHLRAKQICIAASTSELYAHLMKILCDPGDEILVPAPSYPLLEQLAQSEGVAVKRYPLSWDGQWYIDFPALRNMLGSKSKAILTLNPNNPTGSYLSPSERSALRALGIPIICDEVFLPYALDEKQDHPRSILSQPSEDASPLLVLGGLSKFAALPQVKCSWLIAQGPDEFTAPFMHRLSCLADLFLSPHQMVQHALFDLIIAGEKIQPRVIERLKSNLAYLEHRFCKGDSPISLRTPQGGWYATLQLPSIQNDEAWALSLLKETHTFCQPGYFFDFSEDACLVLSLLTPETTFKTGIRNITKHVESTLQQRNF